MKYTLSITQRCNLACNYCYIAKNNSVMPLATVEKILDFIFEYTPQDEKIDIGFFGGEPFLEFDLLQNITKLIYAHPSFDQERVSISVASNGTLFSSEIAEFLKENKIVICISCDGPPSVHDTFRKFINGKGSSTIVGKNIQQALEYFPLLPVNAVYSPDNIQFLPDVIDYLCSLGVKNIYLNSNISMEWTQKEVDILPQVYNEIAQKYIGFYRQEKPRHISLIDSKIAVILRGGYQPLEMCRMGKGEFAFAPSGNVYPCERLIGSDDGTHCIGNINVGFSHPDQNKTLPNANTNIECQTCGIKDYCMNWCGCTNFFSTQKYNMVSPFICASEKISIQAAFQVIKTLNDEGLNFSEHLAGTPLMSIIGEAIRESDQSLLKI